MLKKFVIVVFQANIGWLFLFCDAYAALTGTMGPEAGEALGMLNYHWPISGGYVLLRIIRNSREISSIGPEKPFSKNRWFFWFFDFWCSAPVFLFCFRFPFCCFLYFVSLLFLLLYTKCSVFPLLSILLRGT